jgi:glutamyl-tRNA reductase
MPAHQIAVLGISHNTAQLALRERISCALPVLPMLQASAPGRPDQADFSALEELVLVSTCNRVEIYAAVTPGVDAKALLLDYLSAQHTVDTSQFRRYLYFYEGETAIRHLMAVAAGLDSLVLGEPQILGQVTEAFNAAQEMHTAGPVLSALFRFAIRTGKRARTETAISSNPASIGSVAITLAQSVVGNLTQKQVLVVGAGVMGQIVFSALRKRGVSRIAVANRSRERVAALAASSGWDGPIYTLEELPQALAAADVVICATGANAPVITTPMVRAAQAGSRDKVLIDISVPRNIAPTAGSVPGIHLYNVDHLQECLDAALEARQHEVPQVETIIVEEMAHLDRELRALTVRPLIVDMRQQAEAIRQRELERTLRFLGEELDPETLKHIHHLSRSLVNKLLHEPTLRLREKASNGQAIQYETAIRDLFDLNTTEN